MNYPELDAIIDQVTKIESQNWLAIFIHSYQNNFSFGVKELNIFLMCKRSRN